MEPKPSNLWEIFSHKTVFGWSVIGVIVPGVFVAFGGIVLTVDWFPHNLSFAQILFFVAASFVVTKIVLMLIEYEDSLWSKIAFGAVTCGVIIGVTGYAIWQIQIHKNKLEAAQNTPSPVAPICKIDAVVSSDIVARVYFRGFAPTAKETLFTPSSQEFFYEWRLDLTSTCEIDDVVVAIKKIFPGERTKVTPENPGFALQAKPEWLSGFAEKRVPDYYTGFVHVGSVSPEKAVTLILRMPLTLQTPSPGMKQKMPTLPVQREFTVTSSNRHGTLVTHNYEADKQTDLLMQRLFHLAMQSYRKDKKWPVPIRNPDTPTAPLKKQEFEATMEARCGDALCVKMNVTNLEARSESKTDFSFDHFKN